MVHTTNPQGGADAISIMRTAILADSDPDFAGLMLRCGEADIEVLVVMIPPFPPRARPKVTIGAAPDLLEVEGKVVLPGSAVLLPDQVSALAKGPWQRLPKLSVAIDRESSRIKGVVALDGLADALNALTADCPKK